MDNSFISDMNIFNNDISFLIKLRAKPQILEIVKKKHLDEISDEISIQDKKNDLLIWNAMYTREIVEIQMIDTYINLLINDVEVKDNFVINRILKHLHLNIESQISLKKLSRELNLSEGYISDCFKKHMGMTIMKYAKKIRIDRAKVLLVTTTSSILEIGLTLGFHDQSHFHKVFKSFTGVSPSEYRNNNFG